MTSRYIDYHDEYVQLIASARKDLFDFSDMDIPLPQPSVPVGPREAHILALARGHTTDSIGMFGLRATDLSSILMADDAHDPYQHTSESDDELVLSSLKKEFLLRLARQSIYPSFGVRGTGPN